MGPDTAELGPVMVETGPDSDVVGAPDIVTDSGVSSGAAVPGVLDPCCGGFVASGVFWIRMGVGVVISPRVTFRYCVTGLVSPGVEIGPSDDCSSVVGGRVGTGAKNKSEV